MSRFDCMFIRTSLYLLLEPLHWFLLSDQMFKANTALFPFSFSNIETRPSQHHIEIHTINPNAGVVFDSKINVLLDSKTKVPSAREVFLCQLVFTNLPIMKQANLLAKYNLPCYSTTVETQSTEVQKGMGEIRCWSVLKANTYLQTLLQDFFGFGASHSAMHSNLLISTNAKWTHSVSG